MHILFLADNFPPERNAQASRVYERACHWVRWGHTVTVLTCAPNFPEGRIYPGFRNRWYRAGEMSGIRVVRLKTFMAPNAGALLRILDFLSFMLVSFFAGLFQRRPDVVVATSPQFFAAVAGWALAAVRRRPFVFELSDLWPASILAVGAMRPGRMVRSMEKLELFLYRRAAAVVALTGSFKRDLIARGVAAEKIAVVLNGVELSRYAPRERDAALAASAGLSPEHFTIGYIGTLGMAHGLENVLAAAALSRGTPLRFLFVGAGAERGRLVAEAGRRGLDNVIFVPPQPRERMPAWWSVCDVALVHLKDAPVFETVIPSKIFEAMAMGLPVLLVAPAGEARSIVQGEDAGVWVRAGDPDALSQAAQLLHASPELRRDLARRSLAAAPRYSREKQAREMLAALEAAAPPAGARVASRNVAVGR